MMLVWICALALVGTAIGQKKAAVPSMENNFLGRTDPDPKTIKPCLNPAYYPVERMKITGWTTKFIDSIWYQWIKAGIKNRKKANLKLPREIRYTNRYLSKRAIRRAVQPTTWLKPDKRFYYWHVECPYRVYWLTGFKHAVPSIAGPKMVWCYILNWWWVRARMVQCSTEFCEYRCTQEHQQIRNSVCLENNYRSYSVWTFCPGWLPNNGCMKFPWLCIKKITIRLPQCCECWSCWSMYITHKINTLTNG